MEWNIGEMVTNKENETFETSVTSSTTGAWVPYRNWSQNFLDGIWRLSYERAKQLFNVRKSAFFSHIIQACVIVAMNRQCFPNDTIQLVFLMNMQYCLYYNQLMQNFFDIVLTVQRDKIYNGTNEMHFFILFLIDSCTCFE